MIIGDSYLKKVSSYILNGLPVENMGMTVPQKFRARIAYEAYQMWLSNKQIKPNELIRRICAREYATLLRKAGEGDNLAMLYVDKLKIVPGSSRPAWEIANDVATLNYIIGQFSAPNDNIEKAKVLDASDWLIREGQKMGDAKAVASGAKLKMELNNNFESKEDARERISPFDLNITQDVSIVKSDRVNYTEDEIKSFRKRYGLTDKEVTDLIQSDNGEYIEVVEEDEEEQDIFIQEENEKKSL